VRYEMHELPGGGMLIVAENGWFHFDRRRGWWCRRGWWSTVLRAEAALKRPAGSDRTISVQGVGAMCSSVMAPCELVLSKPISSGVSYRRQGQTALGRRGAAVRAASP
jgi:hypothetical protein